MKSYLRHSKDRRVRGSANGASTVSSLLGTKKKREKKNLSTNRLKKRKKNYHKNYIEKEKKKKSFLSLYLQSRNYQDSMLFALMITDGAGLLALIVAAGISILFEGEMNHGSNLKCERLFSSTHLSIPFPCALHTTQRCRRLHTHTHTPLHGSQQAACLIYSVPNLRSHPG